MLSKDAQLIVNDSQVSDVFLRYYICTLYGEFYHISLPLAPQYECLRLLRSQFKIVFCDSVADHFKGFICILHQSYFVN